MLRNKSDIINPAFRKMVVYNPKSFPYFFISVADNIIPVWNEHFGFEERENYFIALDKRMRSGEINRDELNCYGIFKSKDECIKYVSFAKRKLKKEGSKDIGNDCFLPENWLKLTQ